MSDAKPHKRALRDNRFNGQPVMPGDRLETSLKLSESAMHAGVDVPVTVVRGPKPGPVLFVTGAIHGDEVVGVAIIRRLLEGLERTLERGSVIAVPVCNRPGFESGDRYLPDRRDLNRSFPGNTRGSMAHRMAHALFKSVVLESDAGVDLHTAAQGNSNLCHVRGDADVSPVKALMRAFGTPILLHGAGPKGSLRQAASRHGVPCIVFEAGEPGRFQSKVVEVGHVGILRVLSHLRMMSPRLPRPECSLLVRDSHWVRADRGGLLDLDVEPGDLVSRHQVLARLFDPLGTHVDAMTSPHAGVVLGVATSPRAFPGNAVVHLGKLNKTLARAKAFVDGGGDLGHLGWRGVGEAVGVRRL